MIRLVSSFQKLMLKLCSTPTRIFPHRLKSITLVDDVIAAVAHYAAEGCEVLAAPFDITIGKCAVIRDPFGARLCILDLTKGLRPLNLAGSPPEGRT